MDCDHFLLPHVEVGQDKVDKGEFVVALGWTESSRTQSLGKKCSNFAVDEAALDTIEEDASTPQDFVKLRLV